MVRRGGGPYPADGGDVRLAVVAFEGLSAKVEVGRASPVGDSYRVCIVEDLLAYKFQRLDDGTRVSSSDHRCSLPLPVVLERWDNAGIVS